MQDNTAKKRAVFGLVIILAALIPLNAQAATSASACKKIKASMQSQDVKGLALWKKFDANRDSMASINFNKSKYQSTVALLKSVYMSDVSIYSIADKNQDCFTSQEIPYISSNYDAAVQKISELNKTVSGVNSSKYPFNSLRETIWLWIAGEYMNYYTLNGTKF